MPLGGFSSCHLANFYRASWKHTILHKVNVLISERPYATVDGAFDGLLHLVFEGGEEGLFSTADLLRFLFLCILYANL